MKKIDKKGFTMVELLATIVIIGVLSVIGVVSVSKHITNTKKTSYKVLSQTIYEATKNCIAQGKCAKPTKISAKQYTTKNLIDMGYITNIKNPNSSKKNCDGVVTVTTNDTTNSQYENYDYSVQLTCEGVADNTIVWSNNMDKDIPLSDIKISNNNKTEIEKIVCKRALTLHTEKCEKDLCSADTPIGADIAYGNIAGYGKLKSGDAFDCDVNGDGVYNSNNERFYYVTDLDNDTAVLIFYTNTNGNVVGNNNLLGTRYGSGAYGPYNGPTDAIKYLPNISQWKNISLKNKIRAIITPNNNSYATIRNDRVNLPTKFNYSEYAARLLTYQEILQACPNVKNQGENRFKLEDCRYLMENTTYSSYGKMRWYWIENPTDSCYRDCGAMLVDGDNNGVYSVNAGYTAGVRPVIEVPKKNISFEFN